MFEGDILIMNDTTSQYGGSLGARLADIKRLWPGGIVFYK